MTRLLGRTPKLTACLGLALLFASSAALAQFTHYAEGRLVSNQSNARHTDPLLINAWGIAYAPGNPFWISDAGSGWSTLYDGAGNPQSLQVVIPTANGTGFGSPTGIVYNPSQEFPVQGWASIFIFATLDGSISGWSPISNPNAAIVAVDNSASNASYTGLAITNKPSGNFIFAADINNNKVDIYDGNFSFVSSFTDSSVPTGFAPFGIQDINGQVYVTFAPASGVPGGIIDIFTESGTFVKRFAEGSPLNQPWGMAVAPNNFGPLSNTLVVSNNTDSGIINGFDLTTGKLVGSVRNSSGRLIKIDQLWGIIFGGGTSANGKPNELFFTAGPNNNVNGLFGVIFPK